MTVQEITEARMSITPTLPQAQPETEPAPPKVPGVLVLMPFAMTSGVLLWLCHFPASCGWLAWVALVPLFALIRSPARPSAVYFSVFAGGLMFFWPAIQWMRVADPRMYYSWAFLATYCPVYFVLAIFLVRYLERRTSLPLPVTLPIIWTALEFLRCHLGTGFSWYLIGHTQHDWLPIIQIADLTGAYGVTFLVVACNAVLLEVCWGRTAFRRWLGCEEQAPRWSRLAVTVQAVVVLLMVSGTIVYGFVRMEQAAFTAGPRVALVQGSVPQQIRNQADAGEVDAGNQVARLYQPLSNVAFMYRPDLLVWPETSYPGVFCDVAPGVTLDHLTPRGKKALAESRELLDDVHMLWPTNVVLGLHGRIFQDDGGSRLYNSALLIDNEGRNGGRYDKIHRVPLGEYVPLVESIPFLKRFAPYDDIGYSVAEGQNHTQFPMKTKDGRRAFTFGVIICYEDTVPEVARPYGGGGSSATDFLLNISNDGWFDGTSEHEEHLAICRFRAVECRRSVARAVNMGISAVIDGNGRVLRPRVLPPLENYDFLAAGSPAGALSAIPWIALVRNRVHLVKPPVDTPHVWSIPANPADQEEMSPSQWKEFKKTSGVLLATIPLDSRSSFYARHGDWLPWMCWGLLVGALVFARYRRVSACPARAKR